MSSVEIPASWSSALPHLGYDLPPDLTPESAGGSEVQVNLPLELVRQSLQKRENWVILAEVLDAYRKFRPTPLWRATGFERAVGARVPIYVKYEGGNISGSHKLNTALAQAYYYARAGVKELVTGTGAGQWGTALAAACAMFGMECTVFMVSGSLKKKPYRGTLMRTLGATVHASPSNLTEVAKQRTSGVNSLSLAIGEAVEYASRTEGAAFCIGSGETYSILHQSVIGMEASEQLRALEAEVDVVVGCVGAGSNFGGIALPYYSEATSRGVEPPLLVAAESSTTPKLTRGVYAYDQTDATGTGPMEAMYTIGSSYPIPDSHSAGLRFHGAANILSALRHRDLIAATAVGLVEALDAGRLFTRGEMVLPAQEYGHALAAAAKLAAAGADGMRAERGVVVCVSGHGYLDLGAYQQLLDGELVDEAPHESIAAAGHGFPGSRSRNRLACGGAGMTETPLPALPYELFDCLQANIAVLADRWHGTGTHLRLGSTLRFRPVTGADGLPSVERTAEECLADSRRGLGIAVRALHRTPAADRLCPAEGCYVVSDAYHLPWVPYFEQRHMDHSFLAEASDVDGVQVVDGYHNETPMGQRTSGAVDRAGRRLHRRCAGPRPHRRTRSRRQGAGDSVAAWPRSQAGPRQWTPISTPTRSTLTGSRP